MTENTGLDADLATLRRYALAAAFPVESRAEEVRSALDRVEAELARLREERDALAEALTAIRDCAKWYGREPFAFAIAAAIREAAS